MVVETISRAVLRDVNHTLGLLLPHIASTDSVLDIGCGEAYVTAGIQVSVALVVCASLT